MGDVIPRSIWLIVLILVAAIFAGAETAYSYSNTIRIRMLADDGNKKGCIGTDTPKDFIYYR